MRGIRLQPLGRYPATCTTCQQQLALTWPQKRKAEAGTLGHECSTRRLIEITDPAHPPALGRIVVLR